jgi:hypothetical protein
MVTVMFLALTAARGAEWRVLFDGKTFAGWEDPGGKTPPGTAWVIGDGCLKAVKAPRLREDLLTRDSFGDFELEFEWRIAPRGNSGLKYRIQDRLWAAESKPGMQKFEERVNFELKNRLLRRERLPAGERFEEYILGFEYQMIDNQAHPDAAHGGDRLTGSIYSMVAATRQASRPAGEFNRSRIVLVGDRVEHWLNDVKVVDADLRAAGIAAGLAKRWGASSPVYELLTKQPKKRTPIGLQHHGDEVWFRNLRIRER